MKGRTLGLVCALTAILAASSGSLLQKAPASYLLRTNPLSASDRNRRAGAKLYEHECAACHGKEREGIGHAPPLARPEVRNASPGAIFWALRNGSLRRGMPSFAALPEPQRWQIVTFLQAAPNTGK